MLFNNTMSEIEFFKNQIKSFNLKFLSEPIRNFIPKINGNFVDDINFFQIFGKKIKLEKIIQKKKKVIDKLSINEINEFNNLTKKFFLDKYSATIYRIVN